jgi:hypothetical protein
MAFFTFNQGAIEQAQFWPAKDLASAGIKESVLRDLLVRHLDRLDTTRKLMVLGCEYTSWSDASRFIDVLAIDEDQNLVVVEIKRTKDGGHAELQALRYAAMLSTHTFENVVDALLLHTRKTTPEATRDKAQADLLEFLGLVDESEVKLSEMPRIMLISQSYSVEITTTVLWLRNHTDIDISCHTMALYPYGDKFALHFDLLLPLPEQTSYLVKVRNKNIAEAKQAETIKLQQRAWQILENNKQLQLNDELHLVKLPRPKMEITDELQKQATYLGGGKVRWAFDQETYALSPLTIKLCDLHGIPVNSIQGPAHWGKKGSKLSLAETAGTYASAIPSASAKEGDQSTAFDFVSPPVQP